MSKINTYTAAGTKSNTNLPKAFQEKVNMDLLAQAVRVYQDRSHPGLSRVKTRSEVKSSTRKIWRQKGTGRARHGARSAPIFVGGGVAHGPKGVKRTLKMSKKMAKRSLFVSLSLKAKEGKIVVLSNLAKIKKTKEAQKLINAVVSKENLKPESSVSLILARENTQARLAFRNLKNIKILDAENLNTLEVFLSSLLVFEKEAIDILVKTRFEKNSKSNIANKMESNLKREQKKTAEKKDEVKKSTKKVTKVVKKTKKVKK